MSQTAKPDPQVSDSVSVILGYYMYLVHIPLARAHKTFCHFPYDYTNG